MTQIMQTMRKRCIRTGGAAAVLLLLVLSRQLPAQSSIEQIQQAIAAKNASWTAAENWVTRLPAEQRRNLLGAQKTDRTLLKAAEIVLPKAADLPDRLDWRDNNGNWLTPVRNQGSCGSCWAFSAAAQVESWWKIYHNLQTAAPDLAEQFILSCGSAGSCAGGNVGAALSFFQSSGVPPESYFPYQASDTVACSRVADGWESEIVTIPGWGYITQTEGLVDNIKNALAYHPVSATYTVYEDFSSYSGGVYEYVWGGESGGHAVLIVGWNDADSAWICKNSWGPWWGENGYFRIKWGECGIESDILFIYDGITGGNRIQLSPEAVRVELEQDSETMETVQLSNPNADMFEFSAVDLMSAFHPTSFNALDASSIWCGDPEIGGYGNRWLQYLDTPVLDLTGASSPLLELKALWNIEDPGGTDHPWDGWDGWNVWISTDGGENFSVALPLAPAYTCQSLWSFGEKDQGWNMGPGVPGWAGRNNTWTDVRFDLSAFAGGNVVIRFAFASDMGFCTEDDAAYNGLFLDDIRVTDGEHVIFENYGDSVEEFFPSVLGGSELPWLTVEQGAGRIANGQEHTLNLHISTTGMETGSYTGVVTFMTNDTLTTGLGLPVHLTVRQSSSAEDEGGTTVPGEWSLGRNYPNPFNSSTVIDYHVPRAGHVSLEVFDIQGRKAAVLFNGFQTAGSHKAEWHGVHSFGRPAGSGVYLIRLSAESVLINRKVLLLK